MTDADCATATGKDIAFKEITLDQFKENLTKMGFPGSLQERMTDAWAGLAEFGCTYRHYFPTNAHG